MVSPTAVSDMRRIAIAMSSGVGGVSSIVARTMRSSPSLTVYAVGENCTTGSVDKESTDSCFQNKQTVYNIACIIFYYTGAKIIQLNEWGYRDGMQNAKNRGNKEIPLAILSRILAQSFG